jgi:hypothetical protein
MKKSLLLLILLLNIAKIYAQDIIILKSGDEIKSMVVEVLSDQIKYKKFENKQGPSYGIEKSKIFMIRYANGSKDVFNSASTATPAVAPRVNRPATRTVYVTPQARTEPQTNYREEPTYRPRRREVAPARPRYASSYSTTVRSMIYGGINLPTGYFADYQSIGFFIGDETDIPLGDFGLNACINGTFNYFTGKSDYYYDNESYINSRILGGLKYIAPVSDAVELYALGQAGIGIGISSSASTQFNYAFGAGATFNEHLDVSFRYNGASTTSDYYYVTLGPTAFSIGIGYKF